MEKQDREKHETFLLRLFAGASVFVGLVWCGLRHFRDGLAWDLSFREGLIAAVFVGLFLCIFGLLGEVDSGGGLG